MNVARRLLAWLLQLLELRSAPDRRAGSPLILNGIVAAAVFLAPVPTHAHELLGRIVGVSDGDTVTVLTQQRTQERIRLAGVDAPEKGQAFGQAAKRRLSDLAFQRDAVVRWDKRDRYGRIVGVVLVNGQDVGLSLVRTGFAWHFKRYAREQTASERSAYAKAEDDARATQLGLWRDPTEAVPPWEYRAGRRR